MTNEASQILSITEKIPTFDHVPRSYVKEGRGVVVQNFALNVVGQGFEAQPGDLYTG